MGGGVGKWVKSKGIKKYKQVVTESLVGGMQSTV